jgi:hypothetical protein
MSRYYSLLLLLYLLLSTTTARILTAAVVVAPDCFPFLVPVRTGVIVEEEELAASTRLLLPLDVIVLPIVGAVLVIDSPYRYVRGPQRRKRTSSLLIKTIALKIALGGVKPLLQYLP